MGGGPLLNSHGGTMAKLTCVLESYSKSNDVAGSTSAQYAYAVGSYVDFAGGNCDVRRITSEKLNEWIAAQLAAGYSRSYVKNQRGAIMTLLRFAHRMKWIKTVPDLVRPVKTLPSNPEAFTLEEVAKALAFCRGVEGEFPCGIARGPLLYSLVLVAYYSGLRRCDVLGVSMKMAVTDAWAVRQQKTGDFLYFFPPVEVRKSISAIADARREHLFPITKKALWYWWERIEAAIGRQSSLKWLRRSGATHVEMENPGSAQAYLGHRTPGLAWRHYIDRSQIQQRKPLPPSPFGAAGA